MFYSGNSINEINVEKPLFHIDLWGMLVSSIDWTGFGFLFQEFCGTVLFD